MTPPPPMPTGLAAFERATGVAVQASALTDGTTLVRLTPADAATHAVVLAILYDLSDSCDTAPRLAGRLPGLLRGWRRETAVWAYALSDATPLASVAGNVGHVLDGATDLAAPAQDGRYLERARRRGSFLAPPLAAIVCRAATELIATVHAVLIGDGRLTDFSPVARNGVGLLGVVEPGRAIPSSSWRRVAGDAPLLAFDDARLGDWFADRRDRPALPHAVRVGDAPAGSVRVLEADGAVRPVTGGSIEWDERRGPLRLLLATASLGRVTLDVGGARLAGVALADAPAAAETDRAAAEAALRSVGPRWPGAVFDSADHPATAEAAWQAAVGLSTRAAEHATVDPLTLRFVSPPAEPLAAAMLIVGPTPVSPQPAAGRVIVFALPTQRSVLRWSAGDALPIGTAVDAWTLRHDAYEDRWMLAVAGSPPRALHPTGSERLPPLRTDDGRVWAVVFSGPVRGS